MKARENIGLLLLPFIGSLVLAEYVAIFFAAASTNTDSSACLPKLFPGAGRGWEAGVCLTEEQVWCRHHGAHRHVNCPTADCRAEEVRLSVWVRYISQYNLRPSREAVYQGCSQGAVGRIYDHIDSMNGFHTAALMQWAGRNVCAACVPEGDKRSNYLPTCSVVQAACRGLFYTPPRDYTGSSLPLACPVSPGVNATSLAELAATDDFGCPSDTTMFAYHSVQYP